MASIRVLDASCLTKPGAGHRQALSEFGKEFALELMTTGLCGVHSCGVPLQLMDDLALVGAAFFELPDSDKEAVAMARAGRAWRGYFRTGAELTAGQPDLKEGYYFGPEHGDTHPLVQARQVMAGRNLWPAGAVGDELRRVVTAYQAAARGVCEGLMSALALGLGVEPQAFRHFTDPEPTELFRMFHYPPAEAFPDVQARWGVAEHTDMGFLTLLLQDNDSVALEVQTREGVWCEVPPQRGVLWINIGDMLEFVSRGLLWATPHRVRASQGRSRLSFPYFFDPSWTSHVTPLDEGLLRNVGWAPGVLAARSRAARWDALRLHELGSMTYGEFVWAKVKHVFPWLAHSSG